MIYRKRVNKSTYEFSKTKGGNFLKVAFGVRVWYFELPAISRVSILKNKGRKWDAFTASFTKDPVKGFSHTSVFHNLLKIKDTQGERHLTEVTHLVSPWRKTVKRKLAQHFNLN